MFPILGKFTYTPHMKRCKLVNVNLSKDSRITNYEHIVPSFLNPNIQKYLLYYYRPRKMSQIIV